jgi:hypothetical protein
VPGFHLPRRVVTRSSACPIAWGSLGRGGDRAWNYEALLSPSSLPSPGLPTSLLLVLPAHVRPISARFRVWRRYFCACVVGQGRDCGGGCVCVCVRACLFARARARAVTRTQGTARPRRRDGVTAAQEAHRSGLATKGRPEDVADAVRRFMYHPGDSE